MLGKSSLENKNAGRAATARPAFLIEICLYFQCDMPLQGNLGKLLKRKET
jgi:hypothetical protein